MSKNYEGNEPMIKKIKRRIQKQYPQEYLDYFEGFIKKVFGDYETIITYIDPSGKTNMDIYAVPPDKEFPYWKLATVGMSHYKQKLPPFLKGHVYDRSELVMLLEPEWTYDGTQIKPIPFKETSVKVNENGDNNYLWPVQLFRNAASVPCMEGTFTCPGDIFQMMGMEKLGDIKLKNVMVIPLDEFKDNCNCIKLPNGEIVEYYQTIFINDEELESLSKMTPSERLDQVEKFDSVFHPNRPTVDLS